MINYTDKIEPTIQCFSCKCIGFFSTTPFGGDAETCPFCSRFNYQLDNDTPWDGFNLDDMDSRNFSFCDKCKILFDMGGCIHSMDGCTDSTFNCHVISKWSNKLTNEVFIGMPKFEDVADWMTNIINVEILEWTCLNNGLHCSGGYYPKSKYPQYYETCPNKCISKKQS